MGSCQNLCCPSVKHTNTVSMLEAFLSLLMVFFTSLLMTQIIGLKMVQNHQNCETLAGWQKFWLLVFLHIPFESPGQGQKAHNHSIIMLEALPHLSWQAKENMFEINARSKDKCWSCFICSRMSSFDWRRLLSNSRKYHDRRSLCCCGGGL